MNELVVEFHIHILCLITKRKTQVNHNNNNKKNEILDFCFTRFERELYTKKGTYIDLIKYDNIIINI
jgi:hypothetical protein